jgi:hypothetical protein
MENRRRTRHEHMFAFHAHRNPYRRPWIWKSGPREAWFGPRAREPHQRRLVVAARRPSPSHRKSKVTGTVRGNSAGCTRHARLARAVRIALARSVSRTRPPPTSPARRR